MYAVIMAGGGGTRLWPLSRVARPKPFLPLLEGGRLAARGDRRAPHARSSISPTSSSSPTRATSPSSERPSRRCPPGTSSRSRCRRNTAAAVALAAHAIDRAGDDVMIVMPADQVVRDADGLRAGARGGRCPGRGRRPRHARGRADVPSDRLRLRRRDGRADHVGRPADVPRRALRGEADRGPRPGSCSTSGTAYWNAGTFVWRRDALIGALDRHASDIADPIAERLLDAPNGRAADGTPWPADRIGVGVRARSRDLDRLRAAWSRRRSRASSRSCRCRSAGTTSGRGPRSRRCARRRADGNVIDAPAGTVLDVGSERVLRARGGRAPRGGRRRRPTSSSSTRPTRCSCARRTRHRT